MHGRDREPGQGLTAAAISGFRPVPLVSWPSTKEIRAGVCTYRVPEIEKMLTLAQEAAKAPATLGLGFPGLIMSTILIAAAITLAIVCMMNARTPLVGDEH